MFPFPLSGTNDSERLTTGQTPNTLARHAVPTASPDRLEASPMASRFGWCVPSSATGCCAHALLRHWLPHTRAMTLSRTTHIKARACEIALPPRTEHMLLVDFLAHVSEISAIFFVSCVCLSTWHGDALPHMPAGTCCFDLSMFGS